MKCRSENHEWTDPLCAERCCSGEYRREMRHRDDAGDLLPEGRTYRRDLPFVYGWVRTEGGAR